MIDTANHYIGQSPSTPPENTGCMTAFMAFVAAFILCLIITIVGGCSRPKEISTTSSFITTTSTDYSDSSKISVTVSHVDTTVIVTEEHVETAIKFSTTEYDTLGNVVKVTEGVMTKLKNKSQNRKSSDRTDIKRNQEKVVMSNSDTKSAENTKKTHVSNHPILDKIFGFAFVIVFIAMFVSIGRSIYIFYCKYR